MLACIDRAVEAIRKGGIVVVVDDEDRENEGDLIMAGEAATAETIAFFVRHTSGVVCAPMTGEDLDRLDIPPMVLHNQDAKGTAFTVSVDAFDRNATGISAADRAHTIRVLADPSSEPADLTRPGHVFPLRAHPGGVLNRPGHTEAAIDLARLAGLRPIGVLSELVNADGSMARLDDCQRFASKHRLPLISIADLIAYRREGERVVERVFEAWLPRAHGRWRVVAYRSPSLGSGPLALVLGEPERKPNVLVHVHVECVLGDVFRSPSCGCGPSLDDAMARIEAEGEGAIVYLRRSRGDSSSPSELECLARLTELTAEATHVLDAHEREAGALVVADLGLSAVPLLTNDPEAHSTLPKIGASALAVDPLGVASETVQMRV